MEGIEGVEPVTMDVVFEVLRQNVERTRSVLFTAIPRIAVDPSCSCAAALSSGPLGA